MTVRFGFRLFIAAAAATIATGAALAEDPRKKVSPTVVPSFTMEDMSAANNRYILSADELKYDCRKLTGHIAIRIRQLRSTRADKQTSEASRTLQKTITPLMNGTKRGIDQDGDNARDLTMLKAYNGRLAALNCATFDLDRLLAAGNTEDPRPIPKPKGKPAFKMPAAAQKPAAQAPAPTPAAKPQ